MTTAIATSTATKTQIRGLRRMPFISSGVPRIRGTPALLGALEALRAPREGVEGRLLFALDREEAGVVAPKVATRVGAAVPPREPDEPAQLPGRALLLDLRKSVAGVLLLLFRPNAEAVPRPVALVAPSHLGDPELVRAPADPVHELARRVHQLDEVLGADRVRVDPQRVERAAATALVEVLDVRRQPDRAAQAAVR